MSFADRDIRLRAKTTEFETLGPCLLFPVGDEK